MHSVYSYLDIVIVELCLFYYIVCEYELIMADKLRHGRLTMRCVAQAFSSCLSREHRVRLLLENSSEFETLNQFCDMRTFCTGVYVAVGEAGENIR